MNVITKAERKMSGTLKIKEKLGSNAYNFRSCHQEGTVGRLLNASDRAHMAQVRRSKGNN